MVHPKEIACLKAISPPTQQQQQFHQMKREQERKRASSSQIENKFVKRTSKQTTIEVLDITSSGDENEINRNGPNTDTNPLSYAFKRCKRDNNDKNIVQKTTSLAMTQDILERNNSSPANKKSNQQQSQNKYDDNRDCRDKIIKMAESSNSSADNVKNHSSENNTTLLPRKKERRPQNNVVDLMNSDNDDDNHNNSIRVNADMAQQTKQQERQRQRVAIPGPNPNTLSNLKSPNNVIVEKEDLRHSTPSSQSNICNSAELNQHSILSTKTTQPKLPKSSSKLQQKLRVLDLTKDGNNNSPTSNNIEGFRNDKKVYHQSSSKSSLSPPISSKRKGQEKSPVFDLTSSNDDHGCTNIKKQIVTPSPSFQGATKPTKNTSHTDENQENNSVTTVSIPPDTGEKKKNMSPAKKFSSNPDDYHTPFHKAIFRNGKHPNKNSKQTCQMNGISRTVNKTDTCPSAKSKRTISSNKGIRSGRNSHTLGVNNIVNSTPRCKGSSKRAANSSSLQSGSVKKYPRGNNDNTHDHEISKNHTFEDLISKLDEKLLTELINMGFGRLRAQKGLLFGRGGGGSVESAIEWLDDHEKDPDIDSPIEITSSSKVERAAVGNKRSEDTQDASTANENENLNEKLRRQFEDASVTNGPYTIDDFNSMWTNAEANIGLRTEDIERTKWVKEANKKVKTADSSSQGGAQYGRIYSEGFEAIIKAARMSPDEKFVDIGHGIGNAPLQAAYTGACKESRGVELVLDRHVLALAFKEDFENQHMNLSYYRDGKKYKVGKVDLRCGSLDNPEHRDFITDCDVALVNNAFGVFAERAESKDKDGCPDDFVAGLFANMEPGKRMVTFHDIQSRLGPQHSDVVAKRKERNLSSGDERDSSFYKMEEVVLGEKGDTCIVTWNQSNKPTTVYVYTRLEQSTTDGSAVFLCCNKKCEFAENGTPIDAKLFVGEEIEDKRTRRLKVNTRCPNCLEEVKIYRRRART